MTLGLIIPAFNESKTIRSVILGLPKKLPGVDKIIPLVINDGSFDSTAKKAKTAGALVVSHRLNLGVGAATSTGFEAARRLGVDLAVTMDADGQHNPNDLNALLKPILKKRSDVTIGTRLNMPNTMPVHRLFGNKLFNAITWLFYQIKTTDSQSGFRAYNKKALSLIEIHTLGYEVCTELFGEFKRHDLRVTEVPIETIYTDHSRQKGQPAINGINIVFKILSKKLIGIS